MIRQAEAPDVFAEYSNYEQLKRMRQAYIMHVLDIVLTDRSIVSQNDKAIAAEESEEEQKRNGKRVTLDNVFDLAKEENGDDDDESDEPDLQKDENND